VFEAALTPAIQASLDVDLRLLVIFLTDFGKAFSTFLIGGVTPVAVMMMSLIPASLHDS
jgi:hypothetical protein